MNISVALALAAMIGYGMTAIIYKLAEKSIDPVSLAFFTFLFATISMIPLWLWLGKEVTPRGIGYGAIAGIISALAFIGYVVAIHSGKVAIVTTLRHLSFAIAVIIGIFVFQERVSMTQGIGIILAAISAVLISL